MAIQNHEELLSHSADVFQREQSLENAEYIDSASVLLPPLTVDSLQRRCEERTDCRYMCSYEIRETIAGKSVVIGEGGAFVVNGSKEGILLLMALAPQAKQLIEVHISHSGWRKTVSIFEPRWTKLRQVESHGDLYLVGCRRKFGPCGYLSF
jgi:hypothetical protein